MRVVTMPLAAAATLRSGAAARPAAPLWRQRPGARQGSRGDGGGGTGTVYRRACDPRAAATEPDVGILAAAADCGSGYVCAALPASAGGRCVPEAPRRAAGAGSEPPSLRRAAADDCGYYVDVFGYACDCGNWTDNVGAFDCTYAAGNSTVLGVPFRTTTYLAVTVPAAGAPRRVNVTTCYDVLHPSPDTAVAVPLQSYCLSETVLYGSWDDDDDDDDNNGAMTNHTCAARLNHRACASCTVATCPATTAGERFAAAAAVDCSNLLAGAVATDMCGGHSLWQVLTGDGNDDHAEPASPEPFPSPIDGGGPAGPSLSSGAASSSTIFLPIDTMAAWGPTLLGLLLPLLVG